MNNDMLKSIIMEQIDTAEIFYGYKIDDKSAFCKEIISQIPEEYYEGIINEEMGEYIEDLIVNTYKKNNNRKLVSDKILRLIETSMKVNYYSRLISIDEEKMHKLVMSLIPEECYEAILNNEMTDYLENLVNSSFDRLYGDEAKQYDEAKSSENNEIRNDDGWEPVSKSLREMNESIKANEVAKDNNSDVEEIQTIVREYYDPENRKHYIENYIRKILVNNHLTFDDLDQEVNKIMKEHFYNEKAYFYLRKGEYDIGIFEVGLADSNELKNIKKDVADILLTKENKYRDRSEEEKEKAVTVTATLLYSIAKRNFDVKDGKIKADDYIHEEIYHSSYLGMKYPELIAETLDRILRTRERMSFDKVIENLSNTLSGTSLWSIAAGAGLLVLGAATDMLVPIAILTTKVLVENSDDHNRIQGGGGRK